MTNFIDLEKSYEFDVYPKRDLVLVRGKGARVWDADGKEYIDCISGHGVANIGHCNDRVIAALERQSRQLISCSMTFYNDTRARFLEKLLSIAPKNLKRAFLCNSGTEAVEAAIKFTRFTSKKKEFITAMRGFHGRTPASAASMIAWKTASTVSSITPNWRATRP